MSKIYGWHFVGSTLRDGSPIPPDGEWLEYKGQCVMCLSGLHFSDTPFDALQYAPGAILCYVELEDVVDRQSDKGVCSRRKIIARGDATDALRYFARMQALSVIHLVTDPPDVVLDYLATGDEDIRAAARDAAWGAVCDAARAAAGAAARDAARDAAWDAAKDAAWDAAGAAAWAAAWGAVCDAARAAAWAAARDEFNNLIYECFEDVLEGKK